MRSGVVAVMVLTCAALARAQQTQPATAPAADPSTPRGALRLLNQAMRDGDVATIKRMFLAANPSESKMIDAVAQMSAALADLRRAAVKAYGEEEATTVTGDSEPAKNLERIDSAEIVINGQTATVTYKDQKDSPFVLKKLEGHWQVPASELGKPIDPAALTQQLADLAVQTSLVRQITQEIDDGKFPTAKKAGDAWRTRLLQAVTSQPTTRPTKPNDSDP